MGIVFPAVSAMTAKLVEAGLIVKESHENDGRHVLIKLTGLGQDACQQIKAVWAEHSPINTAGYSDDELRAFIKFGRSVLPASSSGN